MKRSSVNKVYRQGLQVRSSTPLDNVHTDIIGPIRKTGYGGKRFIITFIDEATRRAWVYNIKRKDEATNALKKFISEAGIPKKITADSGGEYQSFVFQNVCHSHQIELKWTTPHKKELHGIAERFNRTLCERASALLFTFDVPTYL